MPYSRPQLTDLRNQVSQDIASQLPGSDPLLRFSNLNILGVAQANLANLHYGYLDWIAKQATPFTATEEFLEGWAALKGIFRKAASSASGRVTFNGTNGALVPAGTGVVRGDGVAGVTTASVTVAGGVATVPVTMNQDPTGLTGSFGNSVVGIGMSLSQAIAGVQANGLISTIFTGGADIEDDDTLRSRMFEAYQAPPQGGAGSDYVQWAKEVPGVTRAWCLPNGAGAGTVVVFTMFDASEVSSGGFPQGANGVSTDEPRAVAATGDQLAVANYISPLQPVTALVWSVAPTAAPVDFTISGIPVSQRAAALVAIADVFFRTGTPKGSSIPIAYIWSAISSVSGITDFVITSPAIDIATAVGTLPKLGTITWL
ncbi:MAG: baseplate J/gp47 family protein [Janthinobacterium lividum]